MGDRNYNKEKLVFSSVQTEENTTPTINPGIVVNKAFEQEQLRQTGKIPVEDIQRANQNAEMNEKSKNVEEKIISESVPSTDNNDLSKFDTHAKYKKKRHMKKGFKKILLCVAIITLLFAGIIKYYLYINDAKTIMKKSVTTLGNELLDIIKVPDELTIIGNEFSKEINFTYDIESPKVEKEYKTNEDFLKYRYLISNLNRTNTTITIKHDITNKELYFNRRTLLNSKEIIDDKYLIKNSTEYYFVKNFYNTYINDGNNNYFETITEDENIYDNIQYIYKLILQSIADCIDEEYYNITSTTTYVNNKPTKAKKVSIQLDNAKMQKILNNIIKLLKADKKSNVIINGIYDNFTNYKVDSKKKFIKDNEIITVNIYCNGILNRVKKYELVYRNPKLTKEYAYEIDNNRIIISENNSEKYNLNIRKSSSNLVANITNKNNENIGSIEFDNTKERKHVLVVFEDGEKNVDFEFNYKITEKKRNFYKATGGCRFSIKNKGEAIVDGEIMFYENTSKNVKIDENVSDVIFSKEISEEKKDELVELLRNRLKRNL